MAINYIPRVTQLDAVQLDNQVEELFKQQIFQATKYLEFGILQAILPEVELLIRTWIFKYSFYKKKSTFGQEMLSLKYKPDNISKSKIYWYYGYHIGLKYVKDRALYSFTSNTRVQDFVHKLETFQLIGDILNFLRFIQSGKYPMLIDYILGLELTADKLTREDLTDFSWTRELLWHNFIFSVPYLQSKIKDRKYNAIIFVMSLIYELIGTAISLMNIFGLRSKLSTVLKYVWWRRHVKTSTASSQAVMTHTTVCACCSSKPVLPYTMGCSHIFCYYCLVANKTADPDFPCPKCYYNGKEINKFVMP